MVTTTPKGKKHSSAQRRPGKAPATTSKTTPGILRQRSLRAPKLHTTEEGLNLTENPIGENEQSATHEWVWDSSSRFPQKLPQASTEDERTIRMSEDQSFGSVRSVRNCELALRMVAINKRQEIKIDALEVCNNALIDQIADVTTKYCILGVENSASKSQNKFLKVVITCMILSGFMYFMSEYICQG